MTARVVNLNIAGDLDGTTLVTEFAPATVGPTEADRELDIFTIQHVGNVGLFRMKTLIDAVEGFESSDIFIPQLQFVPGPDELLDLEVLAQTIPGSGIRVPIVNGNTGCIYVERRGGLKVASSNASGSNRLSFLLCPLTTQDQIVAAVSCFGGSLCSCGACDPIAIESIFIDPAAGPGPPPTVDAGIPFDVTFGSAGGTLRPTDRYRMERVTDGNLIFNGPATTFTDAVGDVGVYRVRITRGDNPNCGLVIDPLLEVINAP
jgi:hypothetical protein